MEEANKPKLLVRYAPLHGLTVKQLRIIAQKQYDKYKKWTGWTRLRKAALIAFLERAGYNTENINADLGPHGTRTNLKIRLPEAYKERTKVKEAAAEDPFGNIPELMEGPTRRPTIRVPKGVSKNNRALRTKIKRKTNTNDLIEDEYI